jgi:tetratricopeptide (TPR) repeat protein
VLTAFLAMMNLFSKNKTVKSLLATAPQLITTPLNYQITYNPLPHKSINQLPAQVKAQLEELYNLIQTQPQQTIQPLLDLITQYPNVPVFYNYLNVAYEMTGQPEKAYTILKTVYQQHPDYLFARTNYAFYCLKNHLPEKIPVIFEHHFDLKSLYPQRHVFHITEFTAFTTVMALYHHEIGRQPVAEQYYQLLKQIVPHNQMTKTVKRHLHPSLLQRLLMQLVQIWVTRQRYQSIKRAPSRSGDYFKHF